GLHAGADEATPQLTHLAPQLAVGGRPPLADQGDRALGVLVSDGGEIHPRNAPCSARLAWRLPTSSSSLAASRAAAVPAACPSAIAGAMPRAAARAPWSAEQPRHATS